MKKVIKINKKQGQTPLAAIEQYKQVHSDYTDVKMTYAGRLDPMAEGLLLVLAGDEVYRKPDYLGLSKVYELDILLGAETDTYDILGLVQGSLSNLRGWPKQKITAILQSFVGKLNQEYPPYSAQPVEGKPLWKHAREGNITQKPTKNVEIAAIEYLGQRTVSKEALEQEILAKIGLIAGDFRQETIEKKWQEFFKKTENKEFLVISTIVHCSSGTYMRSLAHNFGKKAGVPALAYRIKRLKIGDFDLE